MHELALARSIYRIADRVAEGRPVSAIYLDVGVLRQVVPEALEFSWGATAKNSPALAGSHLVINSIPAVIACQDCGTQTRIEEDLVFRCSGCGSTCFCVVSGEEFTLTSLDVAT